MNNAIATKITATIQICKDPKINAMIAGTITKGNPSLTIRKTGAGYWRSVKTSIQHPASLGILREFAAFAKHKKARCR
jgi:hypothetical protein